jgi:chromate transporter
LEAAMKADGGQLAVLAGHFALLSLFAVGGANSAVPEMHRLAVDVQHWMTDRQFTDLFALAQVTPGPNVIIVTLIGYRVAGFLGAVVATAAMCAPSCLLAYMVGRIFDRSDGAAWQTLVRRGLVPVTIGLVAATAVVVARTADTGWGTAAISLASAAIFYRWRINPVWVFAIAALIGFAGLA